MSHAMRITLYIGAAVLLVGLAAWGLQLSRGLILTDMENGYSWGLYIAGLAFFVGNAAGGLVLSASIYMFGAKHLKPFARLGALTAFANVVAAMLIVVPDIGRPERLFNLVLHPNLTSPLIWDVVVLTLYALLSLVYLGVMMLPDLPGRWGARLRARVDDPEAASDRWSRRIAPFALVFAVSIHVVTAWIFSTQGARDWWFTAALAPDFVAVAVAAGTAVVLLAAVAFYGARAEYDHAYRSLAYMIFGAVVVHVFFMFNDFFIHAWFGSDAARELLQHTWGTNAGGHVVELAAPLGGSLLLLFRPVRRSVAGLAGSASLLLVGVLVHRMLIMPAAMNVVPLTVHPFGQQGTQWSMPMATGRYDPGASTFRDYWDYFPTAVEWLIFAGILAFAVLVIVLAVRRLPVLKGPAHAR